MPTNTFPLCFPKDNEHSGIDCLSDSFVNALLRQTTFYKLNIHSLHRKFTIKSHPIYLVTARLLGI